MARKRIDRLVTSRVKERISNFSQGCSSKTKVAHCLFDEKPRKRFATLKARDNKCRRVMKLFRSKCLCACYTKIQINPWKDRVRVVLRPASEMGPCSIKTSICFLVIFTGKGKNTETIVSVRIVTHIKFNGVAEMFLSLLKPIRYIDESTSIIGNPNFAEKCEVTFKQTEVGVHHCSVVWIPVLVEKTK